MLRRTNYLGLLLTSAFTLGVVACGPGTVTPDGSTPRDGGTGNDTGTTGNDTGTTNDTGNPGDTAVGPSMSYAFVLDTVTIDANDDTTRPHTGFNLDNLFSDGLSPNDCNTEDMYSTIDQDQNCNMPANSVCPAASGTTGCMWTATNTCEGGVDNQLPKLANTLQFTGMNIRTLLSDQIRTNRTALLMRVTDVESLVNDPSVTVKLYLAYPDFTTDCTMVATDREYTIAQASLTSTTTTNIEDATYVFQGSISGGRLRVQRTGTFELNIPTGGRNLPFPLVNPQIRVSLAANGMTGTNGNLGGAVRGEAVRAAVQSLAPQFASQVDQALPSVADMQDMGMCINVQATPPRYGAIGIGAGFTITKARISTARPVSSAQRAGTCGFDPGDAGTSGG